MNWGLHRKLFLKSYARTAFHKQCFLESAVSVDKPFLGLSGTFGTALIQPLLCGNCSSSVSENREVKTLKLGRAPVVTLSF